MVVVNYIPTHDRRPTQRITNLSEGPLIAIVDDDGFVREATRALVRSIGFDAVTFSSAEEFLLSDLVEEASCLIADVQMPGLSGLELQSRLAAEGNRTPIIFITAFPEERIRSQAMATGACGFLSKPFKEESLIGCIEAALAGRRAQMA